MSIDQTAGAAPVFLGLPLITTDADTASDVVCSDATMHSLRNRLYQLDATAPCASVGSVGTETIIAGFWVGSSQESQSFDCIFMLNMNLKRFKVEYSNDNGSSYTLVSGTDYSGADYGSSDLILFLASPLTANKLKLTMYDVTDKSICVFDCALTTFQPNGRPMSHFDPIYTQARREIILADGTKDVTYNEWSDNSYTLKSFSCDHDFIVTSDKTNFETVFNSLNPCLYMPEPGDDVRTVVLAQLKKDSYVPKYVSTWKGAGYNIRYTMEPLGYV